ncbi:unnamed protein product, partial [Lampetra planeri]
MHHHPQNRERAINLSILSVSGPGLRGAPPSSAWSSQPLKTQVSEIGLERPERSVFGESRGQRSLSPVCTLQFFFFSQENRDTHRLQRTTSVPEQCLIPGRAERSAARVEHPPPRRLRGSVEGHLSETGRLGLRAALTASLGARAESGPSQVRFVSPSYASPPRNYKRRAPRAGGTVRTTKEPGVMPGPTRRGPTDGESRLPFGQMIRNGQPTPNPTDNIALCPGSGKAGGSPASPLAS